MEHTDGQAMALYTLWVNIELALRMQESAEDMTAAETAPKPKKDTHWGEGKSLNTDETRGCSIITCGVR